MKHLLLRAALAAVLAAALAMPASAARILKLNESLAPGSPEEVALNQFKKLVEEKTKGEIEVRIFLQDQLGNPQTSLENLMNGTLDLYSGALEYYQALAPKPMTVVSLPFFLQDHDHLRAYLKSPVFEEAKKTLLDKGIRFISTEFNADRGPYRVLVTAKAVRSAKDLEGLRMRMFPNQIAIRSWQTLGAVPIQIAWTETYLAIRQGTVSAVTAPLSLVRSMKFTEVAPFVVKIKEYPQTWPMTASEKVWKTLPPGQQQALVESANEAGKVYAKETFRRADDDIAFMKQANKAEFIDVKTDEFRAKMAPLYKALTDEGVLTPEILDTVNRLAKK
ncbi:MAG: TRAP transporter substrate-binding protein [Proteobacteria bacterium]|nr:TRAP transporter substrate-binding protein [Pseudomonadota bacterium]